MESHQLAHDWIETASKEVEAADQLLFGITRGDYPWDGRSQRFLDQSITIARDYLNRLFPTCERADPVEVAAEIAALRALPYDQYLKTDWWQGIRQRALLWAEYRCQVCYMADRSYERQRAVCARDGYEMPPYAGVELNVHHRTYRRRGYEALTDVIVLCGLCHALFHERIKLAR